MPLGQKIRALRRGRRITLKALARDLGVHFTTVSAWERGRTEPDLEALTRLAALLGVRLAELLGVEDPGRRPVLSLPVWDRARWDDFCVRTEALQIASALLRARGAQPVEGGLDEVLLHGRPSAADLLRIGSGYEVLTQDAPKAAEGPTAPFDPQEVARRLRALPPGVAARVGELLLEWLDLFAAPRARRDEYEGAAGEGSPPSGRMGEGAVAGRRRRGLPLRPPHSE